MKTIRRRRHEGRTDFKARLALLKSFKPRLVLRKSNRYITAQFVQSTLAQDKVLVGVTSKDLLSKGWPKELAGSLKGRAAAYLTGLMLGKSSQGKIKEAVLDLGLNKSVSKSRLYAALAGVVESGIKIPCSKDILPSVEELKSNEKLLKAFEKVRGAI